MLYELLRGEQELLSTLDPQLYVKVTGALQAANIRYRVKATSTGSGYNRHRHRNLRGRDCIFVTSSCVSACGTWHCYGCSCA